MWEGTLYIKELGGIRMLFVSMCNDVNAGLFERNKGKSCGFMITPEMAEGEAVPGGLAINYDGYLVWSQGNVNFAEKGLGKVDDSEVYEKGITYEAVADSEENPILFVLCNDIKLYQGISADLKLLRLDDEHVLAALITGACVFNGVPLQRCNNANLDVAKVVKTIDIKNLFSGISFLGKGSDMSVDYSYDALCHGRFLVKADGSYSQRSIRSREYVFDESRKIEGEERLQRAKEEELHKAEELKIRKEAERRAMEEAREAKIKAERERREAEADLKMCGVKVNKDTKVVSVGASEFLKAVSMINN